MALFENFSTALVPLQKRLEFWTELASNTFAPQSVHPHRQEFCANLQRTSLAGINFAVVTSSDATVTRSRSHIARSRDAYYMLHLQMAGYSVNEQGGRELELAPGDFTLVDSSRPFSLFLNGNTSVMVVRMPRMTLRKCIGSPETITLMKMPGGSGASGIASRFLQDLWSKSRDALAFGVADRYACIVLDLLACAYADVPKADADRSCNANVLRVRIIDYIEHYLSDCDLGPEAIATRFRISPRYLHMVFGGEGETVSRYIQRRRLEKCARALKDPMQLGRNITTLAFENGFKSLPHFCRVFREHYGTSARDYRP